MNQKEKSKHIEKICREQLELRKKQLRAESKLQKKIKQLTEEKLLLEKTNVRELYEHKYKSCKDLKIKIKLIDTILDRNSEEE